MNLRSFEQSFGSRHEYLEVIKELLERGAITWQQAVAAERPNNHAPRTTGYNNQLQQAVAQHVSQQLAHQSHAHVQPGQYGSFNATPTNPTSGYIGQVTQSNPWATANPVGQRAVEIVNGKIMCHTCRNIEWCSHRKSFLENTAPFNDTLFYPTIVGDKKLIYYPVGSGYGLIPVTISMVAATEFGGERTDPNVLMASIIERGVEGRLHEFMMDPSEGIHPVLRAIEGYYSSTDGYRYLGEKLAERDNLVKHDYYLRCPLARKHSTYQSEKIFLRRVSDGRYSYHDIITAELASMEINRCCVECFQAIEMQGSEDAEF